MGSINYMLKLTEDQAAEIRQIWDEGGVGQIDLAAKFGVSQSLISHIVTGKAHIKPRGRNIPPKGKITEKGRECSRCGEFKLWAEFSPNSLAKLTGHQSACKPCRNRVNLRGSNGRVQGRVTDEGRECARCGVFKLWPEFYRDGRKSSGYRSWCKLCCSKRSYVRPPAAERPSAKDLRAQGREWRLRNQYGITPEQYVLLLETQEHLCALCREPEKPRSYQTRLGNTVEISNFHIDHDHGCDQGHAPEYACIFCIRGLLCNNCNWMIGLVEGKSLLEARFSDYLSRRPFLAEGGEAHMKYPGHVGRY